MPSSLRPRPAAAPPAGLLPRVGRLWRTFVATLLVLFAALPAAQAQFTDTTPPKLTALDFTPRSVDVATKAAQVSVTLHVTDDLAGVEYVRVSLTSPSRGQTYRVYSWSFDNGGLVGGNALDGDFRVQVPIPQGAEAGDWRIAEIELRDNAANRQTIDEASLRALGFPTVLQVTSVFADTTPPQLMALSFLPNAVNVSAAPATIDVRLGARDTQHEVDLRCRVALCYTTLGLRSPSGKQYVYFGPFQLTLASGTPALGVWRGNLTMPRYAEAGRWTVDFLTLSDTVGNTATLRADALATLGITPTIDVTASPSDTTPPSLTGFSLSPTFMDTSASGQNLTMTLSMTDALAGFRNGYLNFRSPSGGQEMWVYFDDASRIAGTPFAGTWSFGRTVPRYAEAGTWSLSYGGIADNAGNWRYLYPSDLAAAGMSSTFQVILPSLVADGTAPVEGGTVLDTTFGERASVTVAPYQFPEPVTISIDVLSADLQLPVPSGFSTNATRYVNVEVRPTQPMPFGWPGLTLVLPLMEQMVPGTELTLYKVDPRNGNLVPEPSVTGLPAVGTVNDDGMSATFPGVAALSTVVGLVRSTAVVGDVDGSGKVDCGDVAIVRNAFGKRSRQTGYDARADLNRDGIVDVRDLATVSRALPSGTVCRITPTGAVPLATPPNTVRKAVPTTARTR